MITGKPRSILELEHLLGIQIYDSTRTESNINRTFFRINSQGLVTELYLRKCGIKAIDWIEMFQELKILVLSNNEISDMGPIGRLKMLRGLDLANNRIFEIKKIESQTTLMWLSLGGNYISEIKELENLTNLVWLSLDTNQITEIKNLEKLVCLTYLSISNNHILEIKGLDNLSKLAFLCLDNNDISKIEGLERLNELIWLSLNRNDISEIKNLDNLKNLLALFLKKNKIVKIKGLDNLTRLTELSLNNNNITKLECLKKSINLTAFSADNNEISEIEGLEKLVKLVNLSLNSNQITEIKGLEAQTRLVNLSLNSNQITEIKGLEAQTRLVNLSLNSNQIVGIDGLRGLNALKWLDISANCIDIRVLKGLAPSPLNILQGLRIDHNPFVDLSGLVLPPLQDHLQDIKAILKKEGQVKVDYDPFCKVMLLGNHSSGKSTFLKKYDPDYRFKDSTHVLSVHRATEPNAIFYDFGGQDYYHGIYQAFFTTQSLYFLFWDAKKDRNFVSVDDNGYQTLNFNRPYWLGQIAYACNRCMSVGENPDGKDTPQITDDTIIIQTHADETGAKQQTLGCTAGDSILEEIYVSFKPNGKSATYARRYLKERVREVIANRNKPIKITEKDKQLYEALPSIAERYKYNPISLEALAAELNMEREKKDRYTVWYLKAELNQLSLRGEVLYYRENEKLNHYVWLNPAAFVQMIHGEILPKNDINGGTVPKEVFERKLHRLSSGNTSIEHSRNGNMILQLLLEELIVYEDKDCYVIPGYLPLHSDDEAYKWLTLGFERPNFVLKFERFIPFGLINQIIAYYGREEGALKRYWRDQVIFTAGREMDRRQIEQEEKKEGLPKANAEDYLIWIKLDFTDLAISVFIKEQRKTSAKDMQRKEVAILSDILDMYWNNIPPREQIGDKGAEQTRSSIRETNRKKRPIQDLYLSCAQADKDLTESHYIHLGTLDDESKTTARIAAYPLKNGVIDKERVREVSTRPYKHLSVNKNLATAKQIFISYSKEDQTELETCLQFFKPLEKNGQIEIYYDRLTKFETPIHPEIRKRIVEADCIIALISQRYLATDYILDHELPVFREYNKTIVPILIKPCTFEDDEFLREKYFAQKAQIINLGKEGKTIKAYDSITASAHRDENWVAVVREFKEKILRITKQEVNTDE